MLFENLNGKLNSKILIPKSRPRFFILIKIIETTIPTNNNKHRILKFLDMIII